MDFTEAQDAFLRSQWSSLTARQAASALGCQVNAVMRRASELGLVRDNSRKEQVTARESDYVKRHYGGPMTTKEIADALGWKVTRLRAYARRHGLTRPKKPKDPKTKEKTIKAGYKSGRPVRQIAAKLGMTVNQVVSVARRKGLTHQNRQASPTYNKSRTTARSVRNQQAAASETKLRKILGQPHGWNNPRRLSIGDIGSIRFKTCQWIDGEPSSSDECKCGAPTTDFSSYCAEHHARCYTRVVA